MSGHTPSANNRRHSIVNGRAMDSAIIRRIDAGILSGPVAFASSNFFMIFKVYRVRRAMKSSSNDTSGWPKKGQSTISGGNADLEAKVVANRFALHFGSLTHSCPSRKGGIEEHVVFLSRSYRFSFHHCLLPFFKLAIFSFNFLRYR